MCGCAIKNHPGLACRSKSCHCHEVTFNDNVIEHDVGDVIEVGGVRFVLTEMVKYYGRPPAIYFQTILEFQEEQKRINDESNSILPK